MSGNPNQSRRIAKAMYIVIASILVLSGTQSGFAQLTSQRSGTAANGALPGEVNVQASRVYIFVDKSGVVGHQHAVEGKLKQGQLFQGNSQPGLLVFDMKSFDADGSEARKYLGLEGTTDEATRKKVNENMLGPEILSVSQFPEARFDKIVVKLTNRTTQKNLPEIILEGDFTLHKTTRHIEIRCELEEKEGWHHIRGAFKIKQSDYGIKPFSKMMGAVGVKDELMIVGDIWVVPAP